MRLPSSRCPPSSPAATAAISAPATAMRRSNSFFGDIKGRELDGSRARNRPRLCDLHSDAGGPGAGVLTLDHQRGPSVPLAVSFGKTSRCSHLLAVSDEDGYLSLFNIRRRLPSATDFQEKKAEARVCNWLAHENAVFDISWIKDDTQILTASGDQTIKLWASEHQKLIGVLAGHKGSVKSISSLASNPSLLVSGSRDGSFSLWDLRSSSSPRLCSVASVERAHMTPLSKSVGHCLPAHRGGTSQSQHARRSKAPLISVTSVLYLKDEVSIATAGASDSVVKFWDTRNLKSSATRTCSDDQVVVPHEKGKKHGITSLSQDSSGTFLAATCMDDRIYLYNLLSPTQVPLKILYGSMIDSFYVKSAISHDGAHVLCGSGDGDAYIWQVRSPPGTRPIRLRGHNGEVTAVDWCSAESDMLATCSDDFTVRIWNRKRGSSITPRSPACFRKRVMANAVAAELNTKCRKLVMDDTPEVDAPSSAAAVADGFHTPESAKKRRPATEVVGMEAQSAVGPAALDEASPSSVLNPPTSLKRKTILDYFAST